MTADPEERAAIALMAKLLLQEFDQEVSEDEIKAVLEEEVSLSAEDEEMLANFDPLAFHKSVPMKPEGKLIELFPVEGQYDLAVGLNREGKEEFMSAEVADKLKKARERILEKLRPTPPAE